MDYRWIEVTTEKHVATVALDRTDSLNALSLEFAKEIFAVFEELDRVDDVRVIILKSNARIFCTGLDLKDAMSRGVIGDPKQMLNFPTNDRAMFECCHAIEECRKPVIAAVHGMCIGAGFDIVSACDLRLCTEDATFSLREARIGVVADMGVLQRLPYIIGQAFTRQMAYTGRFFTAREVERMGMVIEVFPDQEALMAGSLRLAAEIAESAPLAVQNTKEVLNYSRTATVRDGVTLAAHKNMVLFKTEDFQESVKAFEERRKPEFRGR